MRGGSYELDSNVARNDRRRAMGCTTVNSKVGFRCVNGVARGAQYGNNASYVRCYRYGTRARSFVLNSLGFRLNGAIRGGYYGANTVDRVRSAGQRFGVTISSGQLYRGFRSVNGVIRGGRFSREASYILSGYRNGINKRTSAFVDVGFR